MQLGLERDLNGIKSNRKSSPGGGPLGAWDLARFALCDPADIPELMASIESGSEATSPQGWTLTHSREEIDERLQKSLEKHHPHIVKGENIPGYLSVTDVADHLDMSRQAIHRQIQRGNLKAIRIGTDNNSPYRISHRHLNQFVAMSLVKGIHHG